MDREGFSLGGLVLNQSGSYDRNRQEDNPRYRNIPELLKQVEKNSGVLTLGGNKIMANAKDLEYISYIGTGSCGTVTKKSYKGFVMAVKAMPRSPDWCEMSRVLMDLDVISRSFDCPYIVKCYGYFITDTDVQVCMECMATCLDRLLKDIKRPIPENIIGKLLISIVKALDYLKTEHQIMHRDVKPSNILLNWDGVIKLCDFGIAGRLIESKAHSRQAGCPLYMGPERLNPENSSSYDIRSDVWSLGLTLVELATGEYPFANCANEFNMMSSIMNDPPPKLKVEDGFSADFCEVVDMCLQRDPEKRPNYKKLLEHRFLRYHETLDTDVEKWFASVKEDEDEED